MILSSLSLAIYILTLPRVSLSSSSDDFWLSSLISFSSFIRDTRSLACWSIWELREISWSSRDNFIWFTFSWSWGTSCYSACSKISTFSKRCLDSSDICLRMIAHLYSMKSERDDSCSFLCLLSWIKYCSTSFWNQWISYSLILPISFWKI